MDIDELNKSLVHARKERLQNAWKMTEDRCANSGCYHVIAEIPVDGHVLTISAYVAADDVAAARRQFDRLCDCQGKTDLSRKILNAKSLVDRSDHIVITRENQHP